MYFESATQFASVDLSQIEPNELVRRVQLGCSDSATELSNRFVPRLLILLERRMPGRHADAEDLAQEALARAFQSLDRFDFAFRFSTWLYTIAFRLSTDMLRKERRRPKSVSLYTECLDIPAVSRGSVSNVDHIDHAEIENVWGLAKSHLTEPQFSVLWLKYAEEMSIQEIATILRKSQIGVRVMLHRARERLAKEWKRQEGCTQ